ncbi:MAG: hypothetical protein V4642_12760 [Bacteroidota bacterium]
MIHKETFKKSLENLDFVIVKLHGEETEFQIWTRDNLEKRNSEYNVEEFLPDYFAFGSDGGLEMLAVEITSGIIYSIPFIAMDSADRIKVADSLQELVSF